MRTEYLKRDINDEDRIFSNFEWKLAKKKSRRRAGGIVSDDAVNVQQYPVASKLSKFHKVLEAGKQNLERYERERDISKKEGILGPIL